METNLGMGFLLGMMEKNILVNGKIMIFIKENIILQVATNMLGRIKMV